ncbi:benzoate/H(+) symporter BenE family transporter [Pseudarthrobacter sp. DSP2-3-2b1]|uniref:benzoate/H(+) symporter BenE family transporter n=1 Tax=Pseudarthrobacter sp. DSP2-3-2b1 TaxID=2804661 RepID=UPI003CECAC26
MAVESEDRSARLREWYQPLGISLALVTLASSLIAVPLSAAEQLNLPDGQVTAWVMTIYTLPCAAGLVLTLYHRQPLFLTGNIFVLIFIASLQGRLTFAELAGASLVAGAAVVAITALGLAEHLAQLIPEPVVVGLLAGSTLPFAAGIFTGMGSEPVVIGGAFLAYVLGRKYLEDRVPAIFLAMVIGIAAAVALGRFGTAEGSDGPALPVLTLPVFTWDAVLTATPVMVVLIVLQSNVPSLIFLRGEGYRPPVRLLDYVSGLGTMAASFLGPAGLSLSLPATAMVAGEDAGPHRNRHRAVVLVYAVFLALTPLAVFAAGVAGVLPLELLVAIAGLAVIGILSMALKRMTSGPLTLGPLVAFAVAVSDLTMLGLGPYFWSLAFGVGVSWILEPAGIRELRTKAGELSAGAEGQ